MRSPRAFLAGGCSGSREALPRTAPPFPLMGSAGSEERRSARGQNIIGGREVYAIGGWSNRAPPRCTAKERTHEVRARIVTATAHGFKTMARDPQDMRAIVRAWSGTRLRDSRSKRRRPRRALRAGQAGAKSRASRSGLRKLPPG
jgi:hypothetical protein